MNDTTDVNAGLDWRNWAGNQRATAAAVARPASAAEVADLVRTVAQDGRSLKAVGSGHSFTAAAATSGVRVELGALTGLAGVDGASRLVRVRAGTTLATLNTELAAHGLAMP